mmetsp:Transcript_74060/g.195202  ORF Transcript_74060/g.195202 Transcript_74060/m.195202 type:complete len:246 (+) Transcript_74060:1-738(+)
MPRLQVHGEGALALAAALVLKASRHVEVPQHGHEAVAVAVGAADVAALRADVGDRQADSACGLGDQGALLQGVVNALDAIVLHGEQEARRHLGHRRARVEQRRRRVRELLARHQVVGLDGSGHVAEVDAASHAHQHVLRALDDLAFGAQQVRLLECLEAEVVVLVVAGVLQRGIDCGSILLDEVPNLIGEHACRPALLIAMVVKCAARLRKRVRGHLVQVGHGDARRERGEVRVLLRHVGARLCR